MFGKRRAEELTRILESARQDRESYAQEAMKDRQLIEKQISALQCTAANGNRPLTAVTEDDKIKAAYALNLCTVSISQIISYNDLVVMEQEYDAIINNLNLENIIKNDALLNTLTAILDTITYFRIEAIEKKFIEKQYQQNMKNAIWSAVPSISVILSPKASPIAMAMNLATQIGTGYMNYRKAKCEAKDKQEEQLWKLQETALEQFNGLRRELFNAAWALADQYDFPDRYRLTERQIDQYNDILKDPNYIRRYERLWDIRESFEAYPYFWYYLGNTANSIRFTPGISEKLKLSYAQKAREHFAKFEQVDTFGILREDLIAASCYLEYVDLLDPTADREKISGLIRKAVCKCGKSNDVLQICAMSYLKIGNIESAKQIMRHLVVENFNRKTNAQLLSAIYVGQIISEHSEEAQKDYESLALMIAPHHDYMIPYPESKDAEESNRLINSYLQTQKQKLQERWDLILDADLSNYEVEFYRCFPTLKDHPDDYYQSSQADQRKDDFVKFIGRKAELYVSMLKEAEFPDNLVAVLKKIYMAAKKEFSFSEQNQRELFTVLSAELYSEPIKEMTDMLYDDSWEERTDEFKKFILQIDLNTLTEPFYQLLKSLLAQKISEIHDFSTLSEAETQAERFCADNQIKIQWQDRSKLNPGSDESQNFVSLVAGSVGAEIRLRFEKSMEAIREFSQKLIRNEAKARVILFDLEHKDEADEYWIRISQKRHHTSLYRKDVIAVLDNISDDHDLIFTVTGIYRFRSIVGSFVGRKGLYRIPYSNFKADSQCRNDNINLSCLVELVEELRKINDADN